MVPPPDEAPPALLVVLVAEPPDFLHENVRDGLSLDTTSPYLCRTPPPDDLAGLDPPPDLPAPTLVADGDR